MREALRILFIADPVPEAASVAGELERSGLACEIEYIGSADALRVALTHRRYDCVLSGWDPTRLGGPTALALVEACGSEIPFIVVSNQLDDETALAALRCGAHDYVPMARIGRLAKVIEREVRFGRERATRPQSLGARRVVPEAELAMLDTLFQSAAIGLALLDKDFRIVRVNSVLAEMNGLPAVSHLGKHVRELLPGLPMDMLEDCWRRILATGEPQLGIEFSGETPAQPGKLRHFVEDFHPVRLAGEIIGVGALVREVTAQKELEAALHRSEEGLRLAQKNSHVRIWDWFPQNPGPGSDPSAEPLLPSGLRLLDSLTGNTLRTYPDWHELVHPDDSARIEAEWNQAITNHAPFDLEFRILRDSGELRWISAKGAALYDESGQVARALSVNVDITDLKRTQEELRLANRRFSRLAESGVVGISIADQHGRILEANDAYLNMLGYTREDLHAGQIRWTDDPPEWRQADIEAMELLRTRGSAPPWEKEKLRKDKSRVPVLIGAAMLDEGKVISVSADLSELKRCEAAIRAIEEQLQKAQRMEAIGSLAGGVAHDFNNLLLVIQSYVGLIAHRLAPDDPMRADLDEIRRASDRAADLTRQLLAFSRRQVLKPRRVQLGEVTMGMEKMLRRIMGPGIEVCIATGSDVPSVLVDPSLIERVVMNLAVNARSAMPRGGRLTIRTERVFLDQHFAASHAGVVSGTHVMLSVSDTGFGMDAVTMSRIFEPFFTTKGEGKGTGLGLSTVLDIVQQSGGTIWVSSEPDKGTTFTVYLTPADSESALKQTLHVL